MQERLMSANESNAVAAGILASQQLQDEPVAELASTSRTVDTRFGKVEINTQAALAFRKGLLGMPERSLYTLAKFPVQKFQQFQLLQSLEEDALSFITMPLPLDNDIIARVDIENAARDLGYSVDHVAMLLIVSVHRELKHVRLSVNARAPLFIDTQLQQGEQYVLRNDNYVVRHMIQV